MGIGEVEDIDLIKEVAEKLKDLTFWMTVTTVYKQELKEKLRSDLPKSFTIIENELNVPLRSTKSIVAMAHGKGNYFN